MIPVVLIHQGQSERYPLSAVLSHDVRWGNEVVLIGDGPAATVRMEDYKHRSEKLEPYYVHLSTNHVAFELFCLQRWFILEDWMTKRGIDKVLYTDSDVLLYCNADREWDTWGRPYALTLALGTSAATSYFTLDGLRAFLDYVETVYIGRNSVFAEFERIFQEMRAQNLPGGINDMTLFRYFKMEVRHVKVGEMTEVRDHSTWDHNINAADGYLTEQGHKAIHWIDWQPYGFTRFGKTVRFNSLHFQGGGGKKLLRLCALASTCDPVPGWSGMG